MKEIFKGQLFSLFLLYFLLAGVYQVVANFKGFLDGAFLGMPTKTWFFLAIMSPIAHQYFVWFCWRYQLYRSALTDAFEDYAFLVYKILFALLILSRPISIVGLAIANKDSMSLNQTLAYFIALILAIPALYLFYSVRKYFGFDRAFGIDHFYLDIYKTKPLVKDGIFKYSQNAMYVFGFLILYLPAFIWLSKAAFLLALFNHLYIWVHYYFLEKPDMDFIYGRNEEKEQK